LGIRGLDTRAFLQVHRRHLVETMRDYARVKDLAPQDANFAMVADAEVFRLDAQVRWLDSVEQRLAESGPSAVPEARPSGGARVLPRRRARIGGR
ncbi:MAG: PadR family transcriptional regulator, partial [Frankiaceae bacterium]|nr:PadR family transcriptional regulator [Frankiaceae bacterium]